MAADRCTRLIFETSCIRTMQSLGKYRCSLDSYPGSLNERVREQDPETKSRPHRNVDVAFSLLISAIIFYSNFKCLIIMLRKQYRRSGRDSIGRELINSYTEASWS
ncbi:uncharacterized protein LOC143148108 [Ptiloglossa arizonensis]|uniref:uncharacterized protein LOC143148108 n=1 Tax=Ptiloglossa arizonensis TaxID=3350558 RepID=UPI003F9FCF88